MKKSIFALLLVSAIAVCPVLAQTVTDTITKKTSRTVVQTPGTTPAPAAAGGSMAPDFNVTSIDGKVFDSKALRGKVIVLNLWFINCPFCIQEIAMLNPIVDQNRDKDVVFIGLSINTRSQLESFLKTRPFKYNQVAGAGQLMLMKFGEVGKGGNIDLKFPLHIVIDREGKQVLRKQGVEGVDMVRQELEKQFKK
jgi:peroxiredoxin